MEYCPKCDKMIDLDYDSEHEHFQEMTKTCSKCGMDLQVALSYAKSFLRSKTFPEMNEYWRNFKECLEKGICPCKKFEAVRYLKNHGSSVPEDKLLKPHVIRGPDSSTINWKKPQKGSDYHRPNMRRIGEAWERKQITK
ncbi:MAG TPA: hypothetical protein ENI22_01800 [Candidatus Pacearchaeota archaeon]|nr:hypothetical protein [Candidatus Pacearchaeota archaeon]